MDDFDAFGSEPQQQSDPAAQFLANQQQKLQGLDLDDDDFAGGFPAAPAAAAAPAQQDDFFGDADLNMGAAPAANANDFGLGDDSLGSQPQEQPQPRRDQYNAVRGEDVTRTEPDKIRQWREQQRERLARKDAEEEKRKSELRSSAKQEFDDWTKLYNEQQNKVRAANRDMEKVLIAERDEALPSGQQQVWERVCRLCEFNPKNSKCTKDVSRYRSLLLQLKQQPPVRT